MKTFFWSIIIFLFSSCAVVKNLDVNCIAEDLIYLEKESDESYSLKVKYKQSGTYESRCLYIANSLQERFSIEENKLEIEEFPGKKYNEYLYDVHLK